MENECRRLGALKTPPLMFNKDEIYYVVKILKMRTKNAYTKTISATGVGIGEFKALSAHCFTARKCVRTILRLISLAFTFN